jgi:hypothetical protein
MDQPEDVIQYLRIVWILLESDELVVNRVQTLVGLGQEFAKKIIHAFWPSKRRGDVVAPFTARPVSTQSVNIG